MLFREDALARRVGALPRPLSRSATAAPWGRGRDGAPGRRASAPSRSYKYKPLGCIQMVLLGGWLFCAQPSVRQHPECYRAS